MLFKPFKNLVRTSASIAPLLLAIPFIASTAAATTYNIVDPNFKTIGTLTGTVTGSSSGSCTNPGNVVVSYTQTAYTFTSYTVNGVVEGGTLQGSGSTNSTKVTYTQYAANVQACSYPAAGSSAQFLLPGATLDGQNFSQIGDVANFYQPGGVAYITSATLPVFNTSGTIIGTLGSGFGYITPINAPLSCGSGTSYIQSLLLLASWSANGTYNGSSFQGGGPLQYNGNGTYTDNYIQYLSTPTSGCQPSGFVNTSSINLPFASSSSLYINGVKQTNPQNYSVEFNGTSSGNFQ